MSKINSFTIATAFTFLATTQALANENWTGPYVGIYFGAGQGNADTSFSNGFSTLTIAEDVGAITTTTTTSRSNANLSGNITGSLADLFVGYNFQIPAYPKFILGGQLEGVFFSNITLGTNGQRNTLEEKTIDDGVVISTTVTQTRETFEWNDQLNSMFSFLGRAGYLLQPNLFLYAIGGGAEGNFVIPSGDDFFGEDQSIWVLGYTVGAGLEYKINPRWSVRGEYRFINFEINRDGSTSLQEGVNPEGPNNNVSSNTTTGSSSKTDFNFSMGKIGVVYQFDPAKK